MKTELVTRLGDDTGFLERPTNTPARTIRNIASGALEGLLAIPAFFSKCDDKPATYQIAGIPGIAINIVTDFATLYGHDQIIAEYGLKGLIPTAVLVVAQGISACRVAVNYTRRKAEENASQLSVD